ncbi:hypothetical protein HELRODRAFT_161320 [Helobdella robusta]|uniref:Major facilitator superfamily (MFS) profile domain-containing protein n=1 Tax=Helobdella robusta TaxID=6412 RepID=T1ERC1_HELRO|nr:hypothetical protein HELRODRAFT_161320 [Helobdella robusta]ESO02089.1 hypothetical protein HELRODRAFT_161320 [Helobdella robusta]
MDGVQNAEHVASRSAGGRIVVILTSLRKNIWSFIVFYLIFSFTHGIHGSYTASILATLEKNFNLPSSLSSIVVTIACLGYMSSAISVSFFITPNYHVRLFAICMLVTGCCGFLYSLTHFIFKENVNYDAIGMIQNIERNVSIHKTVLCNVSLNPDEGVTSICEVDSKNKMDVSPNYVALVMFIVAEVFHGAAGACLWTVGFSFIDDNLPVNTASKIMG